MSQSIISLSITASYKNRPDVLRAASLEVREGEVLGLIGQSGSGKSTMALAILRLLELKGGRCSGSIVFQNQEVLALSERQMREVRGRDIGLVLQSPLTSLNPALRIETQLAEAWKAHVSGSPRDEIRRRIKDVMASVSLPHDDEFLRRFPSQLSVGQAQRVLIAMAVLHRPALLIADEPTSALDVITQSEILELFRRLNREMGTAILYISHDLLSVASICDRIAILHEGTIVERGPTGYVFNHPEHPHTQKLIRSLPEKPTRVVDDPFEQLMRINALTVQ